jgi:uncharacterized protein (TIGR02271 family)
MIGTDTLDRVIGADVYDADGDKIGTASEVYLDDQSGNPEWVTVKTGLFGTKETFVPIRDADLTDNGVRVPVSKSAVKDAPKIDTDGHLSPQEEQELYRHYGLGTSDTTVGRADDSQLSGNRTDTTTTTGGNRDAQSARDISTAGAAGDLGTDTSRRDTGGHDTGRSDTGRRDTGRSDTGRRDTVGRDTSGPTTDDAMTRSEEQLSVGTTSEEAGRARLRKYVVTENVTQSVPVSREEVRVEREPITDANVGDALDGPDISEEEHEVTLRAERPVVDKEAVPVERVRLGKETVTENVTVDESLRKEQIDTDGDDRRR